MDYAGWSLRMLKRLEVWGAGDYLAAAKAAESGGKHDEPTAKALAESYTAALVAARAKGAHDCTPGRFLLPGDLAGSPALTFAPLPGASTARGTLGREMARRFEAYKSRVVQPFFRDHFARLDRQIILIDVLGAIHGGPQAVEELRAAMADLLGAFKPGRNAFLSRLLGGRRVDRILFAATKADHLHHEQHSALTALTAAMVQDAKHRAEFAGAKTHALSLAALRTTVEETRTHNGLALGVVRGTLEDTDKEAALYPGALPEAPALLLDAAREGAEKWLDADYTIMRFKPAPNTLRPGEGPPHIRLDRAAEFLLADRLR
jgi:predicted YcjX-like family ATPase